MNNVLIEFNESNHYIIVPEKWFNHQSDSIFTTHIMGMNKNLKQKKFNELLNKLKRNNTFYLKTNREMRTEVLNYYNLPKEKQIKIKLQP